MAIDTTRRHWQNRRVWQKNSAVQALGNIIMNILSCTKSSQSWKSSIHDRTSVPDSYHRYCKSLTRVNFWLLTFAHAYRHATAIFQTTKLYRAHSTLSRHQLRPRASATRAHIVTWRTSTVSNRTSQPWQTAIWNVHDCIRESNYRRLRCVSLMLEHDMLSGRAKRSLVWRKVATVTAMLLELRWAA